MSATEQLIFGDTSYYSCKPVTYVSFSIILYLLWSVTYISMIYIQYKQKTYGMPMVSLVFNYSWETYHTIQTFMDGRSWIMIIGYSAWFIIDTIIWIQFCFYAFPKYFRHEMSKSYFVNLTIILFIFCILIVYFMDIELNDQIGVISAFSSNLLMSYLFILMLYRRRSLDGQSLWIAIPKCLGTGVASIMTVICWSDYFGDTQLTSTGLLWICYIGCALFDVIYIYFVGFMTYYQGKDPFMPSKIYIDVDTQDHDSQL
eukprot:385611_1